MLKATGIVRRVDDLGRVVIPKEMRRTLGVAEGDPLEFFVNDKGIILCKYAPGCVLCDSLDDLKPVYGKQLCLSCRTSASRTVSR